MARIAQRDKLTLRLPPRFVALEPGSEVEVPGSATGWQVEGLSIEGMAVVAEIRPTSQFDVALAGEPGRFLPPSDISIGELVLALVELPDFSGRASAGPTVYLAASTSAPTWKPLPVDVSSDQFSLGVPTPLRKSVMGSAVTALGDGSADGIDTLNSVEVELIDPDHWLLSCDDDALTAGANLALIGDELIQFADAEVIGPGRFLLTRLLRARYATEWATSLHSGGDLFLLVDPAALRTISLPSSARGAVITASCHLPETTIIARCLVDGRSLRTGLFVDGEQVVGTRGTAIASPFGGATVDTEARAAVTQILESLRHHGLIDT